MSDPDPWLTIIGIGEDGLAGLSEASRKALAAGRDRVRRRASSGARRRRWPRQAVAGAVRCHLRARPPWPSDGGARLRRPVLAWRGRQSRRSISSPDEWIAHPSPSTFSLVASRLGLATRRPRSASGFTRRRSSGWCRCCRAARASSACCATPRPPPISRHGSPRAGGAPRACGRSRRWAVRANASTEGRADSYAADIRGKPVGARHRSGRRSRAFRAAPVLPTICSGMTARSPSGRSARWRSRRWRRGRARGFGTSVPARDRSRSNGRCAGGTAIAIEAREDRAANIRANAEAFGLDAQDQHRHGSCARGAVVAWKARRGLHRRRPRCGDVRRGLVA